MPNSLEETSSKEFDIEVEAATMPNVDGGMESKGEVYDHCNGLAARCTCSSRRRGGP